MEFLRQGGTKGGVARGKGAAWVTTYSRHDCHVVK